MRLIAVILLLATVASPAWAVDLGMSFRAVGSETESAAERLGLSLSWDVPVCGPPRYSEDVCVWSRGAVTLTSNAMRAGTKSVDEQARWAVVRLIGSRAQKGDEQVFRSACAALVGAIRPDWSRDRVRRFAGALLADMRKERERADGVLVFGHYLFGDVVTCEVAPDWKHVGGQ